jgi:hypothetical protein
VRTRIFLFLVFAKIKNKNKNKIQNEDFGAIISRWNRSGRRWPPRAGDYRKSTQFEDHHEEGLFLPFRSFQAL